MPETAIPEANPMQAFAIVVGIFSMLSVALIGVVSVMNLIRRDHLVADVIMVSACGALFLGLMFSIIPSTATVVMGLVFILLGFPALAVGFLLRALEQWGKVRLQAAPQVAAQPAE